MKTTAKTTTGKLNAAAKSSASLKKPAAKATPSKPMAAKGAPAKPEADAATKPKRKDRWPESVMKLGYAQMPSIIFWGQNKLELKPDEFNVLLQLVSHWWIKDQNPYLSKETIGRRMGKSPRMVQRHLTTLENKGLIKRVERYKVHQGQDSNGYDLKGLVKKLKEIAPDFEKATDLNKRRRAKAETK